MSDTKTDFGVWVVYHYDVPYYFKDEKQARDFQKYCGDNYTEDSAPDTLEYCDGIAYTKQHCVRVTYEYAILVKSQDTYSSAAKHMCREYGLTNVSPSIENIKVQHLYGSKEYNPIQHEEEIDYKSVSFIVDWDEAFIEDTANGMKETIARIEDIVRKGITTYYTDSTGNKKTVVHRYRAQYDVNDFVLGKIKQAIGETEDNAELNTDNITAQFE